MTKATEKTARSRKEDGSGKEPTLPRRAGTPEAVRVEAVMRAAKRSGLLTKKTGRISGRVSLALVRQAKKQTGIVADTELIEFALASVALEDKFVEVFRETRGTVDPDIKLGF